MTSPADPGTDGAVPAARERLHPSRAASPYDRTRLKTGIVHLGVGAFQRAHMAQATEAAIVAGDDLAWGIAGVSLRSPDTRDALAPQAGLYTLAIRDADADGRPRQRLQVIHCLTQLLVAPEDPIAVHERIAHPDTRIVSLTVTEKGYFGAPEGGTIGFIVQGLALRHARGLPPVTLMSLDNLPGNGDVLRGLVLEHARALDAALADWIESRCTFPCSMVDRIVPRTTDADRASISAALGLTDAWPVLGEPFFDWAIEDRFAAGRPDWTVGGARFVAHAEPFEKLKLRMVNGTHSSLAYLGSMAGWLTVDVAIAQPLMRRYLERLMQEEIEPTLPALPGLDLAAYRTSLLQRYANPALAHKTRQIAMDGTQKLPQRLLGTVRDRLAAGAPVELLALGVAGWLHHLRGIDERGEPYPIEDPMAAQLAALGPDARALCTFAPVFGDLGGNERFVAAVTAQLDSLRKRGVAVTLNDVAGL